MTKAPKYLSGDKRNVGSEWDDIAEYEKKRKRSRAYMDYHRENMLRRSERFPPGCWVITGAILGLLMWVGIFWLMAGS